MKVILICWLFSREIDVCQIYYYNGLRVAIFLIKTDEKRLHNMSYIE